MARRRREAEKKALSLGVDCLRKLGECGVDTNPESATYGASDSHSKPFYSMTGSHFFKKREQVSQRVL